MVNPNTVSLQRALDETRTGDIWLFRGALRARTAPSRSMTNAPVNHVGMTVAIDDLPPLIWHAELGDKLVDLWTGTNHRGVQLNDLRAGGRALDPDLRPALLAASAHARMPTREQEDRDAAGDRADGRHPVPVDCAVDRAAGSAAGYRTSADFTRGIPFVHTKVRQSVERRKAEKSSAGLETAYCAETVAITYEEMGLLKTEKHSNWFDPGKFWSGDTLPLTAEYRLGDEISVLP